MSTCQYCRFWTPPDATYEGTVWGELGKCESAIPYWQAQTRDEETGDQVLDRTKRALVADDGSSYSAALLCRPDFGCVDFEKDTAPADPATTKGTME